MSKSKDFGIGLRNFMNAFSFIRKHGLRWMFIIPVVVWVLFAFVFFAVGMDLIAELRIWIDAQLLADGSEEVRDGAWGVWDNVVGWLSGSASWVAGFLATAVALFIGFFLNKYLVLIILSPVMAYASERTEEILTGNEYPFSWSQLMKDILRGVVIALRNGFMELSISLVLWTFTLFVPILAPLTAAVLFLVSSYFYGFSTFDYVHERRRAGVRQSIRNIRADRWMVLGNGALFNLIMIVPIVGMVVGPVMASVGACMAFVEKSGKTGTSGSLQAY